MKNKYERKKIDLEDKKEEIKNSYSFDINENNDKDPVSLEEIIKDIEEEEVVVSKKKIKKAKLAINIIFTVIVILIVMVAVDIIGVTRFNVGPFFAIPTRTYDDGGTKEYYGIGYKVIKYHQYQGRRDKELGSWGLKYSDKIITLNSLDMAIEFYDNPEKTYNKYANKFVRVISILKRIDTKNNKIAIGYQDDGGKYSLDIVCDLVKDQTNIDTLEEGKEITIIGTVTDFSPKTKKQANRLYISNCFAEQ